MSMMRNIVHPGDSLELDRKKGETESGSDDVPVREGESGTRKGRKRRIARD
jgi:hypothetical protein